MGVMSCTYVGRASKREKKKRMTTPMETAQAFIRELLDEPPSRDSQRGDIESLLSRRAFSKSETLVVLRSLDRRITDTQVTPLQRDSKREREREWATDDQGHRRPWKSVCRTQRTERASSPTCAPGASARPKSETPRPFSSGWPRNAM